MSEISAYHEAGHAFMAIYVGARVRSVTIDPDWDDGSERFADIQVEWPLDRFTDQVVDDQALEVSQLFDQLGQPQIAFGDQQLLHQQAACRE